MSSEVRLGYRFAAVPEWVAQHVDLDGNAVRVYCVLARFTESFPSLDYVAKRCGGCSEDTVRRAIRRLQSVGAVRVSERFDESGRQSSNLYELAGDVPLAQMQPSQDGEGEGGISATPGGGTVATRTREPSTQTRGSLTSDRFDEFWALYPRKVGVAAARTKFAAACKKADPELIIDGLTRRVEWWKRSRTEARFIPHAATWLNQERWTDVFEPVTVEAASRTIAEQGRADQMRDEAETAVAQGEPDTAWQIICERARDRGDLRFGMIADMLATHSNITIARVVDCDLGHVVTVRELHRRIFDGAPRRLEA